MSETKKLLASFNPKSAKPSSGDFLFPVVENGLLQLKGLKSKKNSDFGCVVYVGVPVTENDLFARLVDSGERIENVAETVERFRAYLDRVKTIPVGNVVQIKPTTATTSGFDLEIFAVSPSSAQAKANNKNEA